MTIFCFLWMPLFYLFRRSLGASNGTGGVWALLLGSAVALTRFFLGDFVNPGGFGLSRWLSAFVDIVTLPVLLPLVFYLIFVIFRFFSGTADFANFTLLWLIPGGAIQGLSWSAGNDPILLILVPLLWTALAVGIPFFIDLILVRFRWYVVIPSGLCILILPFLASSAWWAFYSQKLLWGMLFFGLTAIPLIVSLLLAWFKRD